MFTSQVAVFAAFRLTWAYVYVEVTRANIQRPLGMWSPQHFKLQSCKINSPHRFRVLLWGEIMIWWVWSRSLIQSMWTILAKKFIYLKVLLDLCCILNVTKALKINQCNLLNVKRIYVLMFPKILIPRSLSSELNPRHWGGLDYVIKWLCEEDIDLVVTIIIYRRLFVAIYFRIFVNNTKVLLFLLFCFCS